MTGTGKERWKRTGKQGSWKEPWDSVALFEVPKYPLICGLTGCREQVPGMS